MQANCNDIVIVVPEKETGFWTLLCCGRVQNEERRTSAERAGGDGLPSLLHDEAWGQLSSNTGWVLLRIILSYTDVCTVFWLKRAVL